MVTFRVAVPTSPAISGFENPVFDVEVPDVEKRRFEA
jgi:hypothetical protein